MKIGALRTNHLYTIDSTCRSQWKFGQTLPQQTIPHVEPLTTSTPNTQTHHSKCRSPSSRLVRREGWQSFPTNQGNAKKETHQKVSFHHYLLL